jgi:hypothetical protein
MNVHNNQDHHFFGVLFSRSIKHLRQWDSPLPNKGKWRLNDWMVYVKVARSIFTVRQTRNVTILVCTPDLPVRTYILFHFQCLTYAHSTSYPIQVIMMRSVILIAMLWVILAYFDYIQFHWQCNWRMSSQRLPGGGQNMTGARPKVLVPLYLYTKEAESIRADGKNEFVLFKSFAQFCHTLRFSLMFRRLI